jgi:uncharacterized damage-inducible protein DinB
LNGIFTEQPDKSKHVMHEEIFRELDQTSKNLLESISKLSDQQLKYKVNPQMWSIHECFEHIVITEIAVYRILMQHNQGNSSSSSETERIGKAKMEKLLNDRSIKTEAPDDVKPVGRFSSLDELRDKFISNRERITEALKNNQVVFDSRVIVHPVLGEMTKKDWLHFMIHHCERHCKQIEEIKSFIQFQVI